MAREDARTAVRCTVFAFSPPCTRSPGFEVGNERERAIASDRCVNSSTSDKIVKSVQESKKNREQQKEKTREKEVEKRERERERYRDTEERERERERENHCECTVSLIYV